MTGSAGAGGSGHGGTSGSRPDASSSSGQGSAARRTPLARLCLRQHALLPEKALGEHKVVRKCK